MKTVVLTGEDGRIIAIGRPSQTGRGETKSYGRTHIKPRAGQRIHHFDAPPELTDKPLVDLYRILQVDVTQGEPRLIVKK